VPPKGRKKITVFEGNIRRCPLLYENQVLQGKNLTQKTAEQWESHLKRAVGNYGRVALGGKEMPRNSPTIMSEDYCDNRIVERSTRKKHLVIDRCLEG